MLKKLTFLSLNLLALMASLAAVPAQASETAVALSGEEIRQAFQGQTVSGRYLTGGLFTEYHHEDGRALGHNGIDINKDACWTVVADAVCYYYGQLEKRTTHCFSVVRNDRLYMLRVLGSNRINALATIEPGNARNHLDGGRPWVCDGLISQLPPISWPLMSKRLAASR